MTRRASAPEPRGVRGLHQAAWLIGLGLVVQMITLFWTHPTAFLAFILLGGSLVALGILRSMMVALAVVAGRGEPAAQEPAAREPAA